MTKSVDRSLAGNLDARRWEHTSLSVSSIPSAVRFYSEAFGYRVVWRGTDWREDIQTYLGFGDVSADIVMMRAPFSSHILELIEFRNVPNEFANHGPTGVGKAHVAFNVPDVEIAVREAERLGASLVGSIQETPGVGRGCYLQEPSGTFVELTDLQEGVPQVGSQEYEDRFGVDNE